MNALPVKLKFGIVAVVLFLAGCWLCVFVYQSPRITSVNLELFKIRIDTSSLRAMNANSIGMKFINTVIYKNSDKYIFRPPRLIPSYTFRGSPVYEVFGMVTSWEPEKHRLVVNSYIGKTLTVQFDPTYDQSLAYVPQLDKRGNVTAFGDQDFVTDTDSPAYHTLFCPSDIVSLRIDKGTDIRSSSPSHPIIVKEIRLSQRICQ